MLSKKEKEVKLKIMDLRKVEERLRELKADKVGEVFERTIRLDTPDMDLAQKGVFLRVRSGFKTVITLKEKIENQTVRERKETEFLIEDLDAMKYVLNRLGFTNEMIMEKFRQNWKYLDTVICLDTLPFGDFIEIEGEEDAIFEVINQLGLGQEVLKGTYWDLFEEYKKVNNLAGKNIEFSPAQKEEYEREKKTAVIHEINKLDSFLDKVSSSK
jgi:adenylate cyclase class 2